MQEKFNICLISINKEISIGIYQNNKLIRTIHDTGKTSDVLPLVFQEILNTYKIENIFYANGPGNFSAIKLTHIFVRTLSIISGINTYCADSFYFTNDLYINAYGKIYFIKNGSNIDTVILEESFNTIFNLPQEIKVEDFQSKCAPLYVLPAL